MDAHAHPKFPLISSKRGHSRGRHMTRVNALTFSSACKRTILSFYTFTIEPSAPFCSVRDEEKNSSPSKNKKKNILETEIDRKKRKGEERIKGKLSKSEFGSVYILHERRVNGFGLETVITRASKIRLAGC